MSYRMTTRQGDTFLKEIHLKDDDGTTPVSLVGASIEFSIAAVPGGTPNYQYTTSPEVTIPDPAGGEFVLTLTPTQTRALQSLVYAYEATVTFQNGRRLTVLEGVLDVNKEVKA